MPTYVYECSSCNNVFEKEQRITEEPLKSCDCGSTGTVKRVIQPVGIAFKGSGFHINDYKGTTAPTATPAKSEEPAPAAETAADCTGNPSTCACSSSTTSETASK